MRTEGVGVVWSDSGRQISVSGEHRDQHTGSKHSTTLRGGSLSCNIVSEAVDIQEQV